MDWRFSTAATVSGLAGGSAGGGSGMAARFGGRASGSVPFLMATRFDFESVKSTLARRTAARASSREALASICSCRYSAFAFFRRSFAAFTACFAVRTVYSGAGATKRTCRLRVYARTGTWDGLDMVDSLDTLFLGVLVQPLLQMGRGLLGAK